MHVCSIVDQSPEEILGCKMSELTAVFPHWQVTIMTVLYFLTFDRKTNYAYQTGYDKTGRPVLYKQYGKFDATTVKKLTGGTFDNVIRYHGIINL